MAEFNIFAALSFVPFLVYFFFVYTNRWLFRNPGNKNPPPSPPRLPFIGNLHQIGPFPHYDLRSLAQKYGPLMLVHLGCVPTLVITSADVARHVFKAHDINLSDRHPFSYIADENIYQFKGAAFSVYGEYWRKLRSVLNLHLLGNTRVQSLHPLRAEETALLTDKIREASAAAQAVNLSALFKLIPMDILCRAIFGKKYDQGEIVGEMLEGLLRDFLEEFSRFNAGDLNPKLSWIKRLNFFTANAERISGVIDTFLETVVEEHNLCLKKDQAAQDRRELLYVLLKAYNDNDAVIDRETLKALIWDLFPAGVDTTSTFMEWVMIELLRHPMIMKKVQAEVREIVKDKQEIEEKDLGKMPYFKAVMKETLRFHPSNPLLLPRRVRQDINVMGYDVARGTMILVNVWAMGRDPEVWDEPEEFRPERFLNCSIDYTGQDFRFIPFGAGRRMCPGMAFGMAMNELVLANLLQKFDWEPPCGMKYEDLDITEAPGITSRIRNPLHAKAIPFNYSV